MNGMRRLITGIVGSPLFLGLRPRSIVGGREGKKRGETAKIGQRSAPCVPLGSLHFNFVRPFPLLRSMLPRDLGQRGLQKKHQ